MFKAYNMLLVDNYTTYNDCPDYPELILDQSNHPNKRLPLSSIYRLSYHSKRLFYGFGLSLKKNNRASIWNKCLGTVMQTRNFRSGIDDDFFTDSVDYFFLSYLSLFRLLRCVKSKRHIHLVPIIEFRFTSFFFFNVIGSILSRFGNVFKGFVGDSMHIFIKLNGIYNSSSVWGKKRSLKRAKSKLYLAKNKRNVLYRAGSIFN